LVVAMGKANSPATFQLVAEEFYTVWDLLEAFDSSDLAMKFLWKKINDAVKIPTSEKRRLKKWQKKES